MLNNEISLIQPDIIHFQEANFVGHKEYLTDFIKNHGYSFSAKTPSFIAQSETRSSAILTLVKQPAIFKILDTIVDNRFSNPLIPTLMTVTEFNGIPIVTFNVHLAWGSREEVRIKQVMQIDAEANLILKDKPNAVFVIAGDFNALDSSDSVRFLRGEKPHDDYATLWTDAWVAAGNPENYVTSDSLGNLAAQTAFGAGIAYPSLIPDRRIDYIFVKGFAHGRNGTPLRFARWADSYLDEVSISDHYGIFVDLLVKN